MNFNSLKREAIDFLSPKECPFKLVRIGGRGDGSYVIPDCLKGITDALSPGVANCKSFEDELSNGYAINCHMCDASVRKEDIDSYLIREKQTFVSKYINPYCSSDSIRLPDWLRQLELGKTQNDLLLQMDIEGDEYVNIIDTPSSLLNKFRIIVLELHGICDFCSPENLRKRMFLIPALLKLSLTHICVHAHPNNAGIERFDNDTSRNFPDYLEITLLRKDFFSDDCPPHFTGDYMDQYIQNIPTSKPLVLNLNWRVPIKNTNTLIFSKKLIVKIAETMLALRVRLAIARNVIVRR